MNGQKIVSIMISLVLILSFPLFQRTTVNASSADFNDKIDIEKTPGIHFDTYQEYESAVKSGEIYSLALGVEGEYTISSVTGAVAIFAAGIIVGYLIDGIILHKTQYSAAQWTAVGIAYTTCKANKKIGL